MTEVVVRDPGFRVWHASQAEDSIVLRISYVKRDVRVERLRVVILDPASGAEIASALIDVSQQGVGQEAFRVHQLQLGRPSIQVNAVSISTETKPAGQYIILSNNTSNYLAVESDVPVELRETVGGDVVYTGQRFVLLPGKGIVVDGQLDAVLTLYEVPGTVAESLQLKFEELDAAGTKYHESAPADVVDVKPFTVANTAPGAVEAEIL